MVFIKTWLFIYWTKCFIIIFVWNGNVYSPVLGIWSVCRRTSYFIFDLVFFSHCKILVSRSNLKVSFSFSFDLKYICSYIFAATVLLPRLHLLFYHYFYKGNSKQFLLKIMLFSSNSLQHRRYQLQTRRHVPIQIQQQKH